MKGLWILLLVVLFSGFVLGAEPSVGVGEGDVEQIEDVIDELPFDDDGDVNFSKYKPFQSRAEERIAEINVYVGPVTRVLWGVELTMSWVFVFAFVVWILMIEFIVVPVSSIFDWGIWWSLLGAGIISTLAMQGFGKDLVVWMESFMTQWWIGFVVLVFAVTIGVVYSLFFNFVKKWADRAKKKSKDERSDRENKVISLHAKLIEDSFGK